MEGFEPHRVPPWPEDPTANIGHDIAVKVPDPSFFPERPLDFRSDPRSNRAVWQ